MNWRRAFGAHLRHMTQEQAAASLRRIQLRIGVTETQPEACRLTGLDEEDLTPWVIAEVCERLSAHAKIPRVAVLRPFDATEQAD